MDEERAGEGGLLSRRWWWAFFYLPCLRARGQFRLPCQLFWCSFSPLLPPMSVLAGSICAACMLAGKLCTHFSCLACGFLVQVGSFLIPAFCLIPASPLIQTFPQLPAINFVFGQGQVLSPTTFFPSLPCLLLLPSPKLLPHTLLGIFVSVPAVGQRARIAYAAGVRRQAGAGLAAWPSHCPTPPCAPSHPHPSHWWLVVWTDGTFQGWSWWDMA